MAGHSKWANIKHRKAQQDKKKSAVFSRRIREISIAAREGTDASCNTRLNMAIEAAKNDNIPKHSIEKAIKKGSNPLDVNSENSYQDISFEGYGPGGVAYLIEAITDNKNRTVGNIRHAFSKNGGELGTNGSVAFLFEHKGVIQIEKNDIEEEQLLYDIIESNAEKIENMDDSYAIYTNKENISLLQNILTQKKYTITSTELIYIPITPNHNITLEQQAKNEQLRKQLESLDDVMAIYSNLI